jgi:hypothetical protein
MAITHFFTFMICDFKKMFQAEKMKFKRSQNGRTKKSVRRDNLLKSGVLDGTNPIFITAISGGDDAEKVMDITPPRYLLQEKGQLKQPFMTFTTETIMGGLRFNRAFYTLSYTDPN